MCASSSGYPDTSLLGGARVSKADARIEACGAVDELNCQVGWLLSQLAEAPLRDELTAIQGQLFVAGSLLADPSATSDDCLTQAASHLLDVSRRRLAALPVLRAFILPGGIPQAAAAHVCRAVCRRAERRVCALPVTPATLSVQDYLNRLSTYFFALARYLNGNSRYDEIIFRPRRSPSQEK